MDEKEFLANQYKRNIKRLEIKKEEIDEEISLNQGIIDMLEKEVEQ